MIHEVDHALRALIEREAVDSAGVEVVFDAPTKDWATRRTVPTIDVYLYDIREDLRRRERGLINEYEGSRIRSRRLPPRHFKLSYLVTAWTQRPEDEHRLLALLLGCFLRHDALPPELVTGPLAELGLPVPVTIALPPPEDRSFADVWSALGGELKPSLDIVVSAPTLTGQEYLAAPGVREPATISLGGTGDWPPRESRQGRAFDHAAGADGPAGPDGRSAAELDADELDELAGDVAAELAAGGSAQHSEAIRRARGLSWQQLAGLARRIEVVEAVAERAEQQADHSDQPAAEQQKSTAAPRRRRATGSLTQKQAPDAAADKPASKPRAPRKRPQK